VCQPEFGSEATLVVVHVLVAFRHPQFSGATTSKLGCDSA
jgi:hypothetical protein